MTNRSSRFSSPSMAANVKRPRLRRVEISFGGPNSSGPGPLNNGFRPHGGTRGAKKHPPGQFSYNRDQEYQRDLQEDLDRLIGNEYYETHGSPCWLAEANREITHSGESPLFVNKLLPPGKFEQEHGVIKFHRALLHTNSRRSSAPASRAGERTYYRPNRTHQYLSATDLSDITDESVLRYGRPTRTTLLRARSRSNSAPVNAYDLRREIQRRNEDVKNNSIFYSAKELYNIYSNDGETMHSFLTGARYNRAHLLDSRGLSVYGVYMPRHNPENCFITGLTKLKDHGQDIPSAPPDSPRSDIDESSTLLIDSRPTTSPSQSFFSRPTSSRPTSSRPTSSRPSSGRTVSRTTASRSQKSAGRSAGTRPRSGKDLHSGQMTPKREPGTEEITTTMPDTMNIKAKNVHVTLKGQKMVDALESKLPRVTGISVPKLRHLKARDAFDEMQMVNQPPPTPTEYRFSETEAVRPSGHEQGVTFADTPIDLEKEAELQQAKLAMERDIGESKNNSSVTQEPTSNTQAGEQPTTLVNGEAFKEEEGASVEPQVDAGEAELLVQASEEPEPELIVDTKERETINIVLPVQGQGQSPDEGSGKGTSDVTTTSLDKGLSGEEVIGDKDVLGEDVVFFITENGDADDSGTSGKLHPDNPDDDEDSLSSVDSGEEEEEGVEVPVIRIEVFETDKKDTDQQKPQSDTPDDGAETRVTADDFPFTREPTNGENEEPNDNMVNGDVHNSSD